MSCIHPWIKEIRLVFEELEGEHVVKCRIGTCASCGMPIKEWTAYSGVNPYPTERVMLVPGEDLETETGRRLSFTREEWEEVEIWPNG